MSHRRHTATPDFAGALTRRTLRNPYEKLAAELRATIERGDLTPGQPLPTAVQLAAQHNVSAGTVNRAIALLKETGLVDAGRGKRAVVSASGP